MFYFVKADHPVLRRIDEFVDAGDLGDFVAELSSAGYENISIDTAGYENISIDTIMPMA